MATATPHTWQCPSCGRRVPLRAEACHCGMTRARAAEAALAAPPPVPVPSARGPRASERRAAFDAMTTDVKLLLGASALALVAGLGWLAFGPAVRRPVPVLGWVDARPPAPAPVASRQHPPFKLPWWK